MSVMMPTTMRGSSVGLSNAAADLVGGAGLDETGGGNAPWSRATSSSIDLKIASDSSARPIDSSQRGDSGSAFRMYQTTSAPNPASTNMARQPKRGPSWGTISVLASALTGKLVTTKIDRAPIHFPRACGGTNSVIVEKPATISAPNPSPIIPRSTISTNIDGANAAPSDAKPKMIRLRSEE